MVASAVYCSHVASRGTRNEKRDEADGAGEKAIGLRRRRIGNGCGAVVMGKVGEREREREASGMDGRMRSEKFIIPRGQDPSDLVFNKNIYDACTWKQYSENYRWINIALLYRNTSVC